MFIPKKSKILEKLVEQTIIVEEAAKLFESIINDWKRLKTDYITLKELESKADECVHNITNEIEKTFILPLDKEDLKELTESIDDVIDNLEQVANRLFIYKIPKSNQSLKDFTEIIIESVQQIKQAVHLIKERKMSSKEFASIYKNIHSLENKGDSLHREVLSILLDGGSSDFDKKDFISILKWKEIFQTLEDTLDKSQHIGMIFERLRIKYQ